MKTQSYRVRGGVVRIAAWHGRSDIASLALRGRGLIAPAVLERLLDRMRADGYQEVVTNALAPAASTAFVDAGFAVKGRLRVLVHELRELPPMSNRTRRARRDERDEILRIDAAAFDDFWRLDDRALRDAARATPTSHTRVSKGELDGFILVGRAATDGYVQRLAVRPDAQRAGLGRTLLNDGLNWLRAHGARRAYVNTQDENDRARTLYETAGFTPLPVGLCVLGRTL
ncbi:MAG: GNAT family N-acetyltransferase [Actinomycetota bacterium]|nr:GNAT family N-acetyltransferase [Actinomycetota bacterium]